MAFFLLLKVILLIPRTGHASESEKPSPSGELLFSSVRLTIEFDPELLSLQGIVQNEQLETACKVWREAWMREQGPWGFGMAADVVCQFKPSSEVMSTAKAIQNYDQWILRLNKINLDQSPAIEATVCRTRKGVQDSSSSSVTSLPSAAFDEKCEARKIIPWSDFSIRLMRHRAFVRLFTASIWDQMPFMSVVGRNLIHFDKLGIRALPEPTTAEVAFPPPPMNLSLVEINFDPSAQRFILRNVLTRDAIERISSQSGVVWLVNRSERGARAEEFNQYLREAFFTLTAKFQLDLLQYERERIKSDVAKLKVVSSVNTISRAELRVGLPLLSLKSSLGARIDLGARTGTGLGGVLSAFFTDSNYSLGTELEEKDSMNQTATSKVSLTEYGLSFFPQITRGFARQSLYWIEGGFVLTSSQGEFKSDGNLPQQKLSIGGREFSVGVGVGLDIPLTPTVETSSSAHFDFGWAAKSTSARASTELAWTPGATRQPNSPVRSYPFKMGLGVHFSSLGRQFVNSSSTRAVQTQATLNGLNVALFLGRVF